ncbi:MAG: DNA-directed RNA polymerase subunit omega [Lachnospiraceae bacterium]|nr:DNA-directed RNA polymerase subunit omega [Lachnospiraceae bacterium]
MLHPSYSDLIDVANKHVEEGDQPIVSSRYSVILAAAKRARQLVEGADPLVHGNEKKPLSVAVGELAEDRIHILPYGSEEEEKELSEAAEETVYGEEPGDFNGAVYPEEPARKDGEAEIADTLSEEESEQEEETEEE